MRIVPMIMVQILKYKCVLVRKRIFVDNLSRLSWNVVSIDFLLDNKCSDVLHAGSGTFSSFCNLNCIIDI